MSVPFSPPSFSVPPDVQKALDQSTPDVKVLSRLLQEWSEDTRSSFDKLSKTSRDASRISAGASPIYQTLTQQIVNKPTDTARAFPLLPITFVNKGTTNSPDSFVFTTSSGSWSLYTDEDTGDSVAYGSPNGATITATAKGVMVPDPEMTGLYRTDKPIYATLVTTYKIIPPAYAGSYDIVYLALKNSRIGGGNYGDFQPGDLLITLDANGGNIRIQVENADHYGLSPLLDWTSTGVARATGLDITITQIGSALTVKYRANGGSTWTTACTDTYDCGQKVMSIAVLKHPNGGGSNTLSFYQVDTGVTTYTFTDSSNYFAFIPTEQFGVYLVNYIYVKKYNEKNEWDGTFLEIDPDVTTLFIIVDITSGNLYYWTGSAWAVYTHILATNLALGAMHTITGGVLGALLRASDATHANFQRITINQPNDLDGVAGAVTDNFLSADANDLPKDSGYSPASFSPKPHGISDVTNHIGVAGAVATEVILFDANRLLARSTDLKYDNTWLTFVDSKGIKFGTGGDATITYNGTNLVCNPTVVGTGALLMNSTSKIAFNAATEYINSGTAGSLDFNSSNEINWICAVMDYEVPVSGVRHFRWRESSGTRNALTYDGNFDQFIISTGNANTGNQIIINEVSWYIKDHDHPNQTNPTLFTHDGSNPDVSNNLWGSLYHNATGLVLSTGANTGEGTVPATIDNYLMISPRGTELCRFDGTGVMVFAASKTLDMYTNASCVLKVPYSAQSGFAALVAGGLKVQKNTDTGKYYLTAGCDDGVARGIEITV